MLASASFFGSVMTRLLKVSILFFKKLSCVGLIENESSPNKNKAQNSTRCFSSSHRLYKLSIGHDRRVGKVV